MLRFGIIRVANCSPITTRYMSRSATRKTNTSEDLAKERYDNRVNEDIDTKRARLLYQSRKRGMLENGVILSSFANKYLKMLSPDELDQYDRLINLPTNDWDIYYWAIKSKPTPPEFETPIMTKLREHIHSKVSNDDKVAELMEMTKDRYKPKIDYYGKSRPNEIILRPKRKYLNLEPDFSSVSLVDYAEELFDDSIKEKGGKYIARMTRWRREYFLKRLKRTISSPVSLRHLSDDDQRVIHGQRINEVDIGKNELKGADLCDTIYERNMKHHQFLQFLMSSPFTKDALEYDDEAKAWAEMIWHRNYGNYDSSINMSTIPDLCKTCDEKLHCIDPGLSGYLPKEILAKLKLEKEENAEDIDLTCQRCRFSRTYSTKLNHDVKQDDFVRVIEHIANEPNSMAIILIDLTDFPSGIYDGLIDLLGKNYQINQKILIVGNKIDMLPYDGPGMIRRVTESLEMNLSKLRHEDSNLNIRDTIVISAKTGFNVNSLVTKVCEFTEDTTNMYLLGTTNSGKSTLFNSLLQSDLSLLREGDLISRVAPYEVTIGNHRDRMLKFPIKTFEGWEIALKQRKYERLERDYKQIEKSFFRSVKVRQNEMPHQTMLINHLEYPALEDNSQNLQVQDANPNDLVQHTTQNSMLAHNDDMTSQAIENLVPNFSDDHPLKKVTRNEPLSAQENPAIDVTAYFHQTPTTTTNDQIHDLLTVEEKSLVFPGTLLMPRKYTLRPLQSLFIGGLGRLDLLTATDFIIVTIFASKYLPIFVIDTRRADQFYNTFLGTPYLGVPIGDQDRLCRWPKLEPGKEDIHVKSDTWYEGLADITLSSVGWAMINLHPDQECILRAFTPEGRGVYKRTPALLPYVRARLRQKKIRNTPLFQSDTYKASQISL